MVFGAVTGYGVGLEAAGFVDCWGAFGGNEGGARIGAVRYLAVEGDLAIHEAIIAAAICGEGIVMGCRRVIEDHDFKEGGDVIAHMVCNCGVDRVGDIAYGTGTRAGI